jgi:uncharacterized repeat protein (TIGR01451 family)
MRNQGLVVVAALAMLALAGAAYAQCDAILSDGLGPSAETYQIGEEVDYYVSLSCPASSCTLTVDQIDFYPPPGSDTPCSDTPIFSLFPGETLVPGAAPVIYTVSDWSDLAYMVQPGDAGGLIEASICTHFSWASGGVPLDDEDSASSVNFVECPEPCIDVTKEVDCDISKVGDTVTYTICVENCGEYFDLTNVAVYDDLLATVYGSPLAGFPSTLAPGESYCLDFPYEIQPGDDSGEDYPNAVVENQANATAIDACDGQTEAADASDIVTVYLVHPGITVDKECLETEPVPPGGDAHFGVTISNTGDIPLDVTTDDAAIAPFTVDAFSDASFTVTRVCELDPIVTNTINVTATIPPEFCELPNEYTDSDTAECPCGECMLDCDKSVTPDVSKAGHDVTYTICAYNDGTNCDLTLISVMDDLLGDLTSSFGPTLASGATECHDFTYTIPADTPSPLVNTVTFTYESTDGMAYECTDTAEVTILHPDIDVGVECMTEPVPDGSTGQFGVYIMNTGDVDLIVTTDWAMYPGPFTLAPAEQFSEMATAPCEGDQACFAINVHAVLPPEYELDNEYDASASDCCTCQPSDCRWTGGGTIDWEASIPEGAHVTHGFEFHCDLRRPNRLQVNWGHPPGDKWHMTELLSATCLMNPELPPPDMPTAPCNEVFATGVGRYNNEPGYIADFHFTDVGEPGVNDWADITITSPGGEVVLEAAGYLAVGNHQAHLDHHPPGGGPPVGPTGRVQDERAEELGDPAEHRAGVVPTEVWSQPIPNPFMGTTTINFGLPRSGDVAIDVYDVAGRHVASVFNGEKAAGTHEAVWNGRGGDGVQVPAGVYFYRLSFDNEILMKKMIVMK